MKTPNIRKTAAFLLAAVAAAPSMAAQPAPAPAPEPDRPAIVVEGRRDQARAVREFLNALPFAGPAEHIARFERAACPAVLGLRADHNAQVVERMRRVAREAGIPLGKPQCAPNVLVLVTADKAALLDEIARRHPYLVASLTRGEVKALQKSPAPDALWHLRESIGVDGRLLTPDAVAGVVINRTTERPSRLRDFAHPTLAGAVLILEMRALTGLTPTQVADYALMRAFTGIDPARIPPDNPGSILKLLETPVGGEVPITLTRWDMAFIRSFYGSDVDRFAPGQRGEIAAGMKKALERGAAAEPDPR